ncbi:MAG: RusA family crossover junction endodeoxyribonuclease [Alphaproteobacteria bacterium]|nr:RusA family crossover junction endodeoxyribonuclease [Alphaproteobacteria bacterium]
MNGIVWRDDALIVGLSIRKRYGEMPRLEIDVYTETAE